MSKLYKQFSRRLRKVKKQFKRSKHTRTYIPLALLVVLLVVMAKIISSNSTVQVEPSSYVPLLNTIAKGESKGNYNAYYGSPLNTEIDFTTMTINEVLAWQQQYVDGGSPSSAVGKYQIVRPTLNGLVAELKLNGDERFDEAMQDKMAIALLERRGSLEFADNKLPPEQFAANLSQEWAALPKTIGENPTESYYAGDGLNAARISIDEVLSALREIKKL